MRKGPELTPAVLYQYAIGTPYGHTPARVVRGTWKERQAHAVNWHGRRHAEMTVIHVPSRRHRRTPSGRAVRAIDPVGRTQAVGREFLRRVRRGHMGSAGGGHIPNSVCPPDQTSSRRARRPTSSSPSQQSLQLIGGAQRNGARRSSRTMPEKYTDSVPADARTARISESKRAARRRGARVPPDAVRRDSKMARQRARGYTDRMGR